ncbi:hypothetical protein Tco_0903072 [Tanacetum coccineum]
MERRQLRSLQNRLGHLEMARIVLTNSESCKTRVSYDLVIFRGDAPVSFVKKRSMESISLERRVKYDELEAMSMTIQSSVKDKILATSSETSKVENAPAEMLRDLDQQMEKREDDVGRIKKKIMSENLDVVKRWLAIQYGVRDAAESVRDTIGFEYCLASSSGWTKCSSRMANNRVLLAFNSFFLASFYSVVLGGMGPLVPALVDAIAGCDNHDLSRCSHFEYVVLDNKYSICSRSVIMEGNGVLHVMICQQLDNLVLNVYGKCGIIELK